ncbi:MAG: 30S ribosomal protein S13 [Patescibacteria group bacterium]
MVRIAGATIPTDKRLEVSLTYIFGIGETRAKEVIQKAKVENKRVRDLTDDEINKIRTVVEGDYLIEGDLRREINNNIKRLKDIGCYRGDRHKKGMPVRGQTTRK